MAISTQLHIVTGKGGTGKTTVAAALAMTLANTGKRVLLCEVEGRQSVAQLFDVPPLPYEETKISGGREGGEVFALAIDAEAALLEYLDMFYRLGRAGKLLDRFGIIDFATTIAPGVRDVLLTGKVYEAAKRKNGKGFYYDAVVLDAPPTGRITRFLNVSSEVAGLAKVGPIRRQADSVMAMLRSRRSRVHLVTVPEEMPVQETLDSVVELTEARLPIGNIVLNLVRPALVSRATEELITDGSLGAKQIAESLNKVGFPGDTAEALLTAGQAHMERQKLQEEQRLILRESGGPVVELPALADGIDLGAIYELSELLNVDGF